MICSSRCECGPGCIGNASILLIIIVVAIFDFDLTTISFVLGLCHLLYIKYLLPNPPQLQRRKPPWATRENLYHTRAGVCQQAVMTAFKYKIPWSDNEISHRRLGQTIGWSQGLQRRILISCSGFVKTCVQWGIALLN
jgi:hypothetical protein